MHTILFMLNTCTPTHTTPTFITEALCLVTYVQIYLTTISVDKHLVQRQLTLSGLVSTTRTNAKATPINDNDYSYHITAVELG